MATQVGNGGKIDEQGYSRQWYSLLAPGFFASITATSWKVKQRGAGANMSVDIGQGDGVIGISSTYLYPGWISSADSNVAVTAADPSNPRIDRVVAYIDLATISTSVTNNTGALKFLAVAGTPAGSPSAPNNATVQAAVGASNPYIDLAQLSVAAGATSVVTANITDKRSSASVRTSLAPVITALSATTTLDYSQDHVTVDASGGARTMTLPDATILSGRRFTIQKIDSSANAVTINTTSSQTINGQTSMLLPNQYDFVEVASNGTNWYISKWGITNLLGSSSITSNFTTTATTATQVTSLSASVNIPHAGKKFIVRLVGSEMFNANVGANNVLSEIWDGTVGSGTLVARNSSISAAQNYPLLPICETPPLSGISGAKTYNGAFYGGGAGNKQLTASSTLPVALEVILL